MKQRLFEYIVPLDRIHPAVASIRTFPGSESTRLMLEEVFETFDDADGNFVEQFQTTAFDARIFELFLHAYFRDVEFHVVRPKERPDFLLTRDGLTVAVEATTSNPPQGKAKQSVESLVGEEHLNVPRRPGRDDLLYELPEKKREELMRRQEHEFPIRLGSALYSKLSKRYWELPVVQGKPFVLAIEAFHADDSLYFTSSGLADYLYGIQQSWVHDADGKLLVTNERREEHRDGAKVIPSNFFSQPGAENISAVLFTNSGTSAKFTRMGYQAGLHRGNVMIARSGFFYNPDPNATTPLPGSYTLDDPPFYERWGHGVTVFHNPNAVRPVPKDFFPSATQVYMDGKDLLADGSHYSPYLSRTVIANYTDSTFTPVESAKHGIGTILRREFDGLGVVRAPIAALMAREVAWFSNRTRTVLGVVVLDFTDHDYGAVILGRDTRGRFRTIEGPDKFHEAQFNAQRELLKRMKVFDAKGQAVFPQGDEDED
jgi:hypothetical protein